MDQYILYPIVALGALIAIQEIPLIPFYIKARKAEKRVHEPVEENEQIVNDISKILEDEDKNIKF